MKIDLQQISVRDLTNGYKDNGEGGLQIWIIINDMKN